LLTNSNLHAKSSWEGAGTGSKSRYGNQVK
jgi:hypothetical protein